MVRDERFAVFSFTGSDAVGWHLKSLAGKKKVVLELGGNAGVYVDESANLEDAAKQIARSAFMYAGQVCIATQRIFVHADIERAFITEILREINAIESGDPANQQIVNGPMISQSAFERCANWIDEATAAGTEVLSGALAFLSYFVYTNGHGRNEVIGSACKNNELLLLGRGFKSS